MLTILQNLLFFPLSAASSIPSNYMTATNNLANGYSSAPPPMTNGQYPQSHPLPPPPPPPSMGTMNGMGSYPPSTGAYPNPSGLSGPSTMPGPSVQQSYPSSRIDPDMVPNVVCNRLIQRSLVNCSTLLSFHRFKFSNRAKKRLRNHLLLVPLEQLHHSLLLNLLVKIMVVVIHVLFVPQCTQYPILLI